MKTIPSGFTLIELVIVIVVVGLLSVVIVPRVIGVQQEAQKAAALSVAAAVNSASGLVYSRAFILNKGNINQVASAALPLADGTNISIAYGYPTATDAGIKAALSMDLQSGWSGSPDTANPGVYMFYNSGSLCNVKYTQATSSAPASVSLFPSNC